MKVKAPIRNVVFEIASATFHYFPDPESADPIEVDIHNRESIEQAADHLGMTPEAVEAIGQSFEHLKDRLMDDLIDILYEVDPNRHTLIPKR